MTLDEGSMECPFCGFKSIQGEYAMLLHLETYHAEGQSPFLVKQEDTSAEPEEKECIECPVEGCGEVILMEEVDYHVELHAGEAELEHEPRESPLGVSKAEGDSQRPSLNPSPQPGASAGQQTAIQAWRNILTMPSSKRQAGNSGKPSALRVLQGRRLGKSQLGKYAHEDRMPEWLVSLLQKGGQVDQGGVIPVLEQFLEQSSTTRYAYLCHPCVHHVSKLKKEGGFCGYRNIQMLASYINGTRSQGYHHFKKKLPSIFQIQDFIESAWDAGINTQGRVETGGIKGTRKYIGTPEALAMFRLLEIPCDAQGFKDKEPGKSEALLLEEVETYFASGTIDPTQRIRMTDLPPIYFQHAGHSMTIIGFQKEKNGSKNLLVFDPMFCDFSSIVKLVGRKFEHRFPDMALKPYRRGNKYLKKYREFEVLRLRPAQNNGKA